MSQAIAVLAFPVGILVFMLSLFVADATLPSPLNILVEFGLVLFVILIGMEITGRQYSTRRGNV